LAEIFDADICGDEKTRGEEDSPRDGEESEK